MTTPSSPDPDKRARWQTLWHKLHAVRFDPLPTSDDVERLHAALPRRRSGESLPDWLRRAGSGGPARKFTLLAEFERWAAGSAAEAYPLPDTPMTSLDEAFVLTVEKVGETLGLRVAAQGFAAFDHAGATLGLLRQDGADILVEFALDEDGNGEATLEDNEQTRLALVRPCLVLVEPLHDN